MTPQDGDLVEVDGKFWVARAQSWGYTGEDLYEPGVAINFTDEQLAAARVWREVVPDPWVPGPDV